RIFTISLRVCPFISSPLFIFALSSFFFFFFFFFNDPAPTEIYILSLHDALPISRPRAPGAAPGRGRPPRSRAHRSARPRCAPQTDRKSTRLNSSHRTISYAVFCLKKKKKKQKNIRHRKLNNHKQHSV